MVKLRNHYKYPNGDTIYHLAGPAPKSRKPDYYIRSAAHGDYFVIDRNTGKTCASQFDTKQEAQDWINEQR